MINKRILELIKKKRGNVGAVVPGDYNVECRGYSGSGVVTHTPLPVPSGDGFKSLTQILPTLTQSEWENFNFHNYFKDGKVYLGENMYVPGICDSDARGNLIPLSINDFLIRTKFESIQSATTPFPDVYMYNNDKITPYYHPLKMFVNALLNSGSNDIEHVYSTYFGSYFEVNFASVFSIFGLIYFDATPSASINSVHRVSPTASVPNYFRIYNMFIAFAIMFPDQMGIDSYIIPFCDNQTIISAYSPAPELNNPYTSINVKYDLPLDQRGMEIIMPDITFNIFENTIFYTFKQESEVDINLVTNLDSYYATMPKEQIFMTLSWILGSMFGNVIK
jgi:hypothetical protein